MKFLLILLVSLCSFSVFASKYPVITSIKTVIVDSQNEDYYITQELMDIGPAADVTVPHGWIVGLAHKHYESKSMPAMVNMIEPQIPSTSDDDVIGSLAIKAYENGGKDETYVWHMGVQMPPASECVAYIAASAQKASWDTAMIPGGCIAVPPADEWCKITTPELLLDHGIITLKDTEGSSASTTMGINCTTPMAVTFQLAGGQPYIYLTPGGHAEIQVDDKPLNSEINVPEGQSTLTVKDILSGVSTEGVTSGSSVLIMGPY